MKKGNKRLNICISELYDHIISILIDISLAKIFIESYCQLLNQLLSVPSYFHAMKIKQFRGFFNLFYFSSREFRLIFSFFLDFHKIFSVFVEKENLFDTIGYSNITRTFMILITLFPFDIFDFLPKIIKTCSSFLSRFPFLSCSLSLSVPPTRDLRLYFHLLWYTLSFFLPFFACLFLLWDALSFYFSPWYFFTSLPSPLPLWDFRNHCRMWFPLGPDSIILWSFKLFFFTRYGHWKCRFSSNIIFQESILKFLSFLLLSSGG